LKIVAVIPAHMASVRFPGKILFPFFDVPMIEHVRRRALMAESLAEVIVATCDDEIASVIRSFGGRVIITSNMHKNGTTRVAEAAKDIDCSHIMLLQGDEPLLLPRHIDTFARAIESDLDGDAWNATGAIEHPEELDRHSFVKCSVGVKDRIVYCFRRSPCYSGFDTQKNFVRKILGIVAYKKEFLLSLTELPPAAIELSESIEQMRIVENGYTLLSVPVVPSLPSVNEPHEVDRILDYIRTDNEQQTLLAKVLAQGHL
jgi:3-deoxy-manno-octulosonate cytidylyltransferase (CMP-KDO synthetase)